VKALLVDGNNVLMRSIMAMAYSGLSADDAPTGPLLSFINVLGKHVREEQPTHLVVCWDAKGHRWRSDVDEDYKANRGIPPEEEFKRGSFALAKEFLALANIASVEVPEAEADDLIAAYWQGNEDGGMRTTILSNDKDFLMLLDERTEQVRVSSGGAPTDRWTAQRVLDDLGCRPEQLPLVMALTGDVSDNVIGVRGIGPKKAVKALVAADWDIDKITVPSIFAARDRVLVNIDLVDLRKPRNWIALGAIPEFRPTTVGSALHQPLVEFLIQYQMHSVLHRYNERALWGWRD
jgi:5'-3' exonuclease